MCISLVLYDSHPELLLLLAFNRDEFWDRPTQPAHFWPDEPCLLAGRDALRKGTWLGVTKHGRFALLTNYREPMNAVEPGKFVQTTTAPSRGALTTNFLTGNMAPLDYLQGLDLSAYYGFNLLVGDLHSDEVAYVSNRDPTGPRPLGPGHYGISNGLLQQWPKVHKCRQALANALELPQKEPAAAAAAANTLAIPAAGHAAAPPPPAAAAAAAVAAPSGSGGAALENPPPDNSSSAAVDADAAAVAAASAAAAADGELPWPVLFHHVMGDVRQVPADQEVPLTGVGEHLDRRLSAVFIEPFEMQPGVTYGTRSQTVIAVWRDGRVEHRERYVEKVEKEGSLAGQVGQVGQVAGSKEDDEEVMWVWKEQQIEFELAAPAGSSDGSNGGQRQQQPEVQQRAAQLLGQVSVGEPWHIAIGHLQQQQQQQDIPQAAEQQPSH